MLTLTGGNVAQIGDITIIHVISMTCWRCAQSYANPSQRRFHTGNRGNPLFSAFFSQNGEFKSKGFRYPCVLSVGFRAMWRPATARAMWRPATVRGRLWEHA